MSVSPLLNSSLKLNNAIKIPISINTGKKQFFTNNRITKNNEEKKEIVTNTDMHINNLQLFGTQTGIAVEKPLSMSNGLYWQKITAKMDIIKV